MSHVLAATLLPPLVPLLCLGLLLWLDRVEQVLETGPTRAAPAGQPSEIPIEDAGTADRPAGVLEPAVAD